MKPTNIFEIINNFRKSAPVDVEGAIKALGIDISYAQLDPNIAGMIERKSNNKYLISVNANDPETRQRFTLAHELGHYIYHRNKMDGGIDDDRMYRSTSAGKYHNTSIGRREEVQANQFAINLLIPWDLISKFQDEGINDYNILAEKFKVSKQAMAILLGVPYKTGSK
jgi:Zn-dependent peptidase ImmA (M78 family)